MNHMAGQLDERIKTIVQQRNEQEAVLESMVEGVLAVDSQEKILNLNAAAASQFGVKPDFARGKAIQEVIRNADLHRFVSQTLEGEDITEGEIMLTDQVSQRFIQTHGSTLRDDAGHNIGAVIVLNDVTQIKRLEDVRRQFVANVSHELKTPITSITGFVETLLEGHVDSAADKERFLGIILKHAKRLNALVEDLLALSRIEQEAEDERVALVRAPLCPVIDSAVQACDVVAAREDVQIVAECESGLEASINAAQLEQALINLINNAVRYSDNGGAVRVTAQRDNSHINIDVADNGCGIDEVHLPRIFERFYRADKARTREQGGTGLGLAIVKHVVLAHGGAVHVESTVGQGSTFVIRLPAID
jgi:two-component system phosphate regulon sensor histidine kinase PhoR